MRRYAAEFIGTFFLVFTIVATGLSQAQVAPLAIGAVLAAMIFAGGHVSGAHFNPAVTLAVFLRGRLAASDVAPYIAAQLIGGVTAAWIARFVLDAEPTRVTLAGRGIAAAFVVELLFTFALAYVVLNVATSTDHPNNSFYGLAIGFTVLAGAFAVGGISGGAFNPAVGVAVFTVGMTGFSVLWIHVVATLAGGAAAALAFRALNPHDVDAATKAPAADAPTTGAQTADAPPADAPVAEAPATVSAAAG